MIHHCSRKRRSSATYPGAGYSFEFQKKFEEFPICPLGISNAYVLCCRAFRERNWRTMQCYEKPCLAESLACQYILQKMRYELQTSNGNLIETRKMTKITSHLVLCSVPVKVWANSSAMVTAELNLNICSRCKKWANRRPTHSELTAVTAWWTHRDDLTNSRQEAHGMSCKLT